MPCSSSVWSKESGTDPCWREMYDPGLKGSRPEINSCKALPVSERGTSLNLYLLPCKFVTSRVINASAMAWNMLNSRQQSVNNLLGASVNGWGIQEPEEQSSTSILSSTKLRRKQLGLSMSFHVFLNLLTKRFKQMPVESPESPESPADSSTGHRPLLGIPEARKAGRLVTRVKRLWLWNDQHCHILLPLHSLLASTIIITINWCFITVIRYHYKSHSYTVFSLYHGHYHRIIIVVILLARCGNLLLMTQQLLSLRTHWA